MEMVRLGMLSGAAHFTLSTLSTTYNTNFWSCGRLSTTIYRDKVKMFTRFKYDAARQEKEMQENTDGGRWMLNTPGNGVNIPFTADPHIRMQKWGANLHHDPRSVEENFRLGFSTTRGLKGTIGGGNGENNNLSINELAQMAAANAPFSEISTRLNPLVGDMLGNKPIPLFTSQSRASHPTWTYRSQDDTVYRMTENEMDMSIGQTFQNKIEFSGANQIQSRMAGKDEWRSRNGGGGGGGESNGQY